MLNNESLCESQMVPLGNIYERLSTVDGSENRRRKKEEEIKDSRNHTTKESSFIFQFSEASTEIFNFDLFFFLSFLLILLPFDYDDYDHKRFKSPQK
jgi:hypothetical protein